MSKHDEQVEDFKRLLSESSDKIGNVIHHALVEVRPNPQQKKININMTVDWQHLSIIERGEILTMLWKKKLEGIFEFKYPKNASTHKTITFSKVYKYEKTT